jgi:hypothetical protein
MIIHLNSDYADKKEDLLNGETRLTYYFRDPIVLNDEHDLIVKDFIVNKDLDKPLLIHDNALDTVLNTDISRQILPRKYNTNVENVSVENVILYEWDGVSAFNPTNARATISCIATEPDLTTGQILVDAITTPGSGFILNNYLYIDKNDLTSTLNTYTNRYAEIKITGLVYDDVAKTLINYSSVAVFPATQNPINERTYDDVVLYKDDGAGWYEDSGVRANVEVKYPYAGATFANINILSITNGGIGITLNQFLYIDKFYIIDGEPTMTYTVRFAKYQVSELVNGLGTTVLSANVEILANERDEAIVGSLLFNDVPVLISNGSGGYINTDALAKMEIIENPTNDNTARANILEFTNGGTGFFVGDIIFIDKEELVGEYNTYDPNVRYAQYEVSGITKDDGLIVSAGNYGLTTYEIGNWYYDIPNKNTRVYIDVIDPPGFSISAYIKKVTGDRINFLVNQTFNIQNSEMINIDPNFGGFGKTGIPLQIQVANLTISQYSSLTYEIYLENILYNTTKYFNSSNNSYPLILSNDIKNKNINFNNVILSLTRQIIQEIRIIVNRQIATSDTLMFSFLLKNNNLLK